MGLAEPRKRTKLSHDPRNLTWTTAEDSYGQRLMQSQGWKAGQALGAKDRKYADTQAAKLTVSIKDDTLGLGASLKSKDIANQRTGFDAFQGLLGRLNAKDEAELHAVEKKIEDKKLATFAQGRWGGMVFVPGGILVQSDPFKQKMEEDEEKTVEDQSTTGVQSSLLVDTSEKTKRKAEKQQRKEQRRLKKEQKLQKKAKESEAELGLPTPDSSSANEGETSTKKEKKKSKKRDRSPESQNETVITTSITTVQAKPRTGRQLLRGKNILAKRAAFSDTKGLDEIFMRKT